MEKSRGNMRYIIALILTIVFLSLYGMFSVVHAGSLPNRPLLHELAMNINVLPIDSLQYDTLTMPQYYQFIQYYDSSMVIFTFGEFQVHRQSGARGYLGLHSFSPYNRPLPENSLDAMYDLSGSPALKYHEGDTVSFFKGMRVDGENFYSGGFYVGVKDTIIYYLEVVNANSGQVLDTVNCWGVLPHDSVTNLAPWYRCKPDTSVIARYTIPDLGIQDGEHIQFKLRPAFMGNIDRLAIVRWDFVEPTLTSQAAISIKHDFNQWMAELLDSLSRKSYRGNGTSAENVLKARWSSEAAAVIVDIPEEIAAKYIAVYTITGREILRERLPVVGSSSISMNVSNLRNGTYFVVAHDNSNILSVSRFEVVK